MKKIFLYAFSLCLLVTSCDSFLDTENLTKKDSSNFPKTEADIQSALTSIYDELRHATDDEEGQQFYISAELLSDDRFGGGGPDDRSAAALDQLLKSDENMFADPWRQNYRGIYRANFLLEKSMALTPAKRPRSKLAARLVSCAPTSTSSCARCSAPCHCQ